MTARPKKRKTSQPKKTTKRTHNTATKNRSILVKIEKPTLHVRITRYNPQMDYHSRIHEYHATLNLSESVIDLLTRIQETQDGSLTFRGSCGTGACGGCGLRVNGKTVLGCASRVSELMNENKTLHVEPLHEKVIKDLVVDEKPLFDDLEKINPRILLRVNDVKRNHKMGVNDVYKLGNTHECNLCGICNTRATTIPHGKISPATLVKVYRYLMDVRDANTQRLSIIQGKLPPLSSLEKANACPRGIFPRDKICELDELSRKHSTIRGRF